MAFDPLSVGIIAGSGLAGAGLSFLGGQNAQAINAGNASYANTLAYQQQEFERQAAQQGIRWRVYDAQQAGISPLVALGAPTFNPGAISAGGPSVDNAFAGAGHLVAGMGQDISRAAMAAQSDQVRADTMMKVEQMRSNSAVAQSEVELNQANAALARRRAEMMATPGMPSPGGIRFVDGQGNSPPSDVTKLDPSKTISPSSASEGVEAGVTPAVKPVMTPSGSIDPQPSLGTSVGATGENLGYILRNRLQPPAGYHLNWDLTWSKGPSWWDRLKSWKGPSGPVPGDQTGYFLPGNY